MLTWMLQHCQSLTVELRCLLLLFEALSGLVFVAYCYAMMLEICCRSLLLAELLPHVESCVWQAGHACEMLYRSQARCMDTWEPHETADGASNARLW